MEILTVEGILTKALAWIAMLAALGAAVKDMAALPVQPMLPRYQSMHLWHSVLRQGFLSSYDAARGNPQAPTTRDRAGRRLTVPGRWPLYREVLAAEGSHREV